MTPDACHLACFSINRPGIDSKQQQPAKRVHPFSPHQRPSCAYALQSSVGPQPDSTVPNPGSMTFGTAQRLPKPGKDGVPGPGEQQHGNKLCLCLWGAAVRSGQGDATTVCVWRNPWHKLAQGTTPSSSQACMYPRT